MESIGQGLVLRAVSTYMERCNLWNNDERDGSKSNGKRPARKSQDEKSNFNSHPHNKGSYCDTRDGDPS